MFGKINIWKNLFIAKRILLCYSENTRKNRPGKSGERKIIMKKYLKKNLAAGLALAAVFSCAGCLGEKNTTENGKTTISVSNWADKDANPKGYEGQMKMVERFNEEYPDIEINGDTYGYDTKTFAAKAEGDMLPTIYTTHFTEASKLMELEYVADITAQIKEYGYYDKINPDIMQEISTNGKVYFVPESAYTMGLVLNLNLFEQAGLMEADGTPKAPKTFDELINVAKTITEKTGKAGFVIPTMENIGGWHFSVIGWNFGVKFIDKVDGKWKANFNTQECVDALQYIKDLKWKYNVLPSNTNVNYSEFQKLIGTDQAAMVIGHPESITAMHKSYGLDCNAIGMAQMPAGPKEHVTMIGGAYRALAPNATEEQKDAAFKWLQFIGVTHELNEDSKQSIRDNYQTKKDNGDLIGIKDVSIWSTTSENAQYKNQIIDEMCNINPNHVRLFNESEVKYQTEEPVCTQDLYATLDRCIQSVLTNENADCKEILEKANDDFQKNFLDYENK